MISGLFDSGAMPVLERLVQFTGTRHQLIAHNVANLSTPNFQPTDLSVDSFQAALREAIDQRRQQAGGPTGPLQMRDTRELRFAANGIQPRPQRVARNILFHDRNNRSLEQTMKDLAENAMTHQVAMNLMKNQFSVLETAIRLRV